MGLTRDGTSSTMASRLGGPAGPGPDDPPDFSAALADQADRWERGEAPTAEWYLSRGRGWSADRAVELIYREYRLAKAAGLAPSKSAYLARFPEHRRALERLLDVDDQCPDSFLDGFDAHPDEELPQAGDAIGPYLLRRELGRGGFARVFLALQADLEDRPVVVKITTRPTREPWLLARARHPNIVEIISHAEVDDGALQLIAMPFLGGAALSAILARRRSTPAASWRFLDDLDAVAAPELRATGAPGPSRAILREMTDAGAAAWAAARLAEALDHASRKGVAHGDVKPSNVLIAGDGTPMLLDFNLAQDWSKAGAGDAGGTLAYMAPERLRAVARAGAGAAPAAPDDERAHRADVYSLGVVLLETLTGWSPSDEPVAAGFGRAARELASTRDRSAWLVRRAEARAGRRLPATLRSILAHCLEADPATRHARGLDLAEDLDRWRADRPLAFAPEPSRLHVAGRWIRRRRRILIGAAAVLAAAALACAAYVAGDRTVDERLRAQALHKIARIVDDPDSRALLPQRPGEASPRRRNPAEAATAAFRALREYEVAGEADWRARDDVRTLPDADREDLELWVLEQALRYGRVLARRDDAPEDWRRARKALDRACRGAWPAAMLALRGRLTGLIGDGDDPASAASPVPSPAPARADAYLRGVDAEVDDEEAEGAPGVGLRRASAAYADVLADRPGSFWGRYRAAVVAFALFRWDEAATHVKACLGRRPDNPVLRGVLATCLLKLDREDEAIEQCDLAIEAAPEHAEFVQVRAFIRAEGDALDVLERDIRRYEVLRRALPGRFLLGAAEGADAAPATSRDLPIVPEPPRGSREGWAELTAGELDARAALASRIHDADLPDVDPNKFPQHRDPRRLDLAASEVEKLLALDPGNLQARVDRMCLAISRKRPEEARRDLDGILSDPNLVTYARFAPERMDVLHNACLLFIRDKQFMPALRLARKIMELTPAVGGRQGRPYYTLACVEALGAAYNRKWIEVAAEHLDQASEASPRYERWFRESPIFDPVRIQVQAALDARRHPQGR